MAVLTEARHAGEFILSEANGMRSRDNVLLKQGNGLLPAGMLLAIDTGKYVPAAAAATAVAVLIYPTDTTDADVKAAAIVRDAEVNGKVLSYAADVDTDPEKATKATQLAAVGIIVR